MTFIIYNTQSGQPQRLIMLLINSLLGYFIHNGGNLFRLLFSVLGKILGPSLKNKSSIKLNSYSLKAIYVCVL